MKKTLILITLLLSLLFITSANATPGRLNSEWCHNSKTIWYHCHPERVTSSNTISTPEHKISTKLQTKIDKINLKIEAIYLKKPSLIIKLQKQIKKIVPKLKKDSDIYIIVIAIDNKIQELVDNSNSTKTKISETKIINSEKNTFNDSFSKAKKYLENDVYNISELSRNTFYCGCDYSSDKKVDAWSCGFKNNWKYISRSKKIEWEHIVPAEAFWHSFKEWRDWDSQCVDSKWKSFKWRNCASKVNTEYRYMQADMYNLVPAIWSINALRSNYSYAMIEWEERQFWTCNMEIKDRKAEPREEIQWDIARVYMYMDSAYPGKWIISNKNRKLFESWDKLDPVSDVECKRYKLIKSIQWNENNILKNKCN